MLTFCGQKNRPVTPSSPAEVVVLDLVVFDRAPRLRSLRGAEIDKNNNVNRNIVNGVDLRHFFKTSFIRTLDLGQISVNFDVR